MPTSEDQAAETELGRRTAAAGPSARVEGDSGEDVSARRGRRPSAAPCRPSADAAAAGEAVGDDLAGARGRSSGRAALVGEDHRDAQVRRHLARDRRRSGPTWPNSQCFRPGLPVGEVGPGGGDDRQVDPAAVAVPDPPIDHVGADGQADPAPPGRHDQRLAAGLEPRTAPRRRGSACGRRPGRPRACRRPGRRRGGWPSPRRTRRRSTSPMTGSAREVASASGRRGARPAGRSRGSGRSRC